MTDDRATWAACDDYITRQLGGNDGALVATLEASRRAGLPDIAVSVPQGKLLYLLAQIQGAQRILEVGTLGGYSSQWLARALPEGGQLISLEVNAEHAAVAKANIAAGGLSDRVEVRVGRAVDSLDALIEAGSEPFDFVFIDADKPNNTDYLQRALKLTHPGAVIVVDNVIRCGAVVDANSTEPNVIGVRRMNDFIAKEPRLDGTAIQTVGAKGYDGFAILRVREARDGR